MAKGVRSVPGWRTKIPLAAWHSQGNIKVIVIILKRGKGHRGTLVTHFFFFEFYLLSFLEIHTGQCRQNYEGKKFSEKRGESIVEKKKTLMGVRE